MSAIDPETPPAGDEIHLPGPTIKPLLLTAGLTMAIVGITTATVFVVAGIVLSIWVTVAWIADTRREIAELPLEHSHPH